MRVRWKAASPANAAVRWRRPAAYGGARSVAAALVAVALLLASSRPHAAATQSDGPAAAPAPEAPPAAASPQAGYSVAEQQGQGIPWELLFSDEFEGPTLNLSKWSYLEGGGYEFGTPGWANGELQYYTSSPDNVRQEGGALVLQAQQSDPANPWSTTSGRVSTLDKFSVCPTAEFPTVRIEARMKVPEGSALWPALWMLPQVGAWANSSCIGCGSLGHWAASGELDVMEAANEMQAVYGSLHFGGAYPDNQRLSGNQTLQSGSLADDWHVYAAEWELSQIRWYIDNYNFYTAFSAASGQQPGGGGWWTAGSDSPGAPFDSPFYLILNLAVGGPNTIFTDYQPLGDTLAQPKQLLVDWVRVHGLPYALSQAQR